MKSLQISGFHFLQPSSETKTLRAMYPLLVMREEKQHKNRTNVFIYLLVTCILIIKFIH